MQKRRLRCVILTSKSTHSTLTREVGVGILDENQFLQTYLLFDLCSQTHLASARLFDCFAQP